MLLELKKVDKNYRAPDGDERIEVLKGINLEVEAGEGIAIVGPSGSGKSTLLNIIGGLDRQTAGKILIDGQDTLDFDETELASFRNKTVGFVFQLHHLLPQCSILENVLIPSIVNKDSSKRVEMKQRAEHLLETVNLQHRLTHRPGEISGGERQRAAVARALINNPKLILADEPTGSLDRDSSDGMAELLTDINRRLGVTLIVVTHATEVAARMQRVFTLQGGELTRQKKSP
jgi:lipoprotein-releasing system ATP-binding protein